jgi:hypothetical protein
MSSSNPAGNHLMHSIGDLWEEMFRFIVSVTGIMEDGSWRADMMVGWIYFILFF